MSLYVVITAEVNGSCKTGLVSKEEFDGDDGDAAQYFVPSAQNVEVHGTVDIDGEAEHMLPSYLVES